MRRTAHLPLTLLLAAVVLTGCVTPAPMPTAPPTPADAPVFASDEEALAVAEEAYGRVVEATDSIIRDGGNEPERVESLLSPALYEREAAGYEQLRQNGWRGIGATKFKLQLQSFGASFVVVYACDDLSNTDVVDAEGTSVVLADRLEHVAYEVEFDVEDNMLLVRKDRWEGSGVC